MRPGQEAVRPGGESVRPLRLWSGVLLAPTAWVLAEMLGYYVTSRSCDPAGGLHAVGPSHPRLVNVALAMFFTLPGLAGVFIAFDNRRRGPQVSTNHRTRFLNTAAGVSGLIFVAATLLFAVPAAVLDVCTHVRW